MCIFSPFILKIALCSRVNSGATSNPGGGGDSSFLTFMLWKLATTDHCLNDNLTPKTTLSPDYRCIQTN